VHVGLQVTMYKAQLVLIPTK